MAVFYTVLDTAEGKFRAYPTKAQAIEAWRSQPPEDRVDGITRITTADMPLRELLCAVYNDWGFAEKQEWIALSPARPESDAS